MTVEDVFANINSHIIEGIMFHDQMAEYFDFLNLHGYKRMHEYHALDEFVERRGIIRYYTNHYNKLLPELPVTDPSVVPISWRNYTRQQVDSNTKRKAIKDSFTKWRLWVKELVHDVDMELKYVDRMHIKLESIDYDLCTISLCQDEMHEEYDNKTKGIGVSIC